MCPNASSQDTICMCPVQRLIKEHTYTGSSKEIGMLNIKSRSVAFSTQTQDAGEQDIKGYGSFLKKGSGIRPVV